MLDYRPLELFVMLWSFIYNQSTKSTESQALLIYILYSQNFVFIKYSPAIKSRNAHIQNVLEALFIIITLWHNEFWKHQFSIIYFTIAVTKIKQSAIWLKLDQLFCSYWSLHKDLKKPSRGPCPDNLSNINISEPEVVRDEML